MKFAILIEEAGPKSFGVYSPDIDCCYAVGDTKEEAVAFFRQAVERYFVDLREAGGKPPHPKTIVETLDVTDVA